MSTLAAYRAAAAAHDAAAPGLARAATFLPLLRAMLALTDEEIRALQAEAWRRGRTRRDWWLDQRQVH